MNVARSEEIWHDRVVRVLVEHLMPADEDPSGWEGGVADYLRRAWRTDLRWAHLPVRRLVDAARNVLSAEMEDSARTTAIEDLVAAMPEERAALDRIVAEGYFGGSVTSPPAGWGMLGYEPWPDGARPAGSPAVAALDASDIEPRYDVVVVGSGPGGGAAAEVLARAGFSVLIVERSANISDSEASGDQIHGKRPGIYDPVGGAGAGNPRHVVEPDGVSWTVDGDASESAWGLVAFMPGGGTRVWQGMAWRFLPEDFRLASTLGVPDGSSLADWPISYDELAPYYDRAEHALGVAGERGPLTARLPREPDYPMPAFGSDPVRRHLGAAADGLGWGWGAIPFALNSVPSKGRRACARCWQCIGHACPVNAKNGAHNTSIPIALATGRAHLLAHAQATRVVHDNGRASGVTLVIDTPSDRRTLDVGATAVVVAAGAVETPRLLLASGIGNDHVGRHLQGHIVSLSAGISQQHLPTFRGPGHSIATLDFVHDSAGPFAGGVIFDMSSQYPLGHYELSLALGAPTAPLARKRFVRELLDHTVGVASMGQEVPMAESRVQVHPTLRDRNGMPGVKLTRAVHPLSLANQSYLSGRGREWLTRAGCEHIVDLLPAAETTRRVSPASEHSAGTVRMGSSPNDSAAAPDGRVRGTRNIYVCDGSLLPTNGSVNPTLTMLANAYRVADRIAEQL